RLRARRKWRWRNSPESRQPDSNRGGGVSRFGFDTFVKDQHAMRRNVVVAGERIAREEIVHGFVELDADGRVLVVEQEENAHAFLLAHADFDVFGNLEQWLQPAHLAQPDGE